VGSVAAQVYEVAEEVVLEGITSLGSSKS